MAALIPVTQPTNVEAAYEDMFKEITRKLYGEETGNGLHTLGTPVAHVATSGPTAPEGERSFTTLMSDRSMAPTIEYDPNAGNEGAQANNFKSEDHLTTAFGLAALMQNGFPNSGGILNSHTLSKSNTSASTTAATTAAVGNTGNTTTSNGNTQNINDQRWNGPSQDIMSWSQSGKLASFNGAAQKSIKSSKNRDQGNEIYQESSGTVANTNPSAGQGGSSSGRKNKNNTSNQNALNNSDQLQVQKRYSCGHCPYSTDRRDLFTRHENIHKVEKPFQCYACLKQFNRADHVKKHFLRMHKELPYDINKTRRSVSGDQKPAIFAQNSSTNQPSVSDSFLNAQRSIGTGTAQDTSQSIAQTIESVATAQVSQHSITMKQEKSTDDKTLVKVKREKRFSCCYCPWLGADKWGLKRHLNTHTKPFVCMLCDYKAARSERLATHVLKVHNKKACNKCSFLADTQEEYQTHINEVHLHDQRPSRNSNNSNNVLRTIGNTLVTNNQLNFQNPNTSFGGIQTTNSGVAIYTAHELTNSTCNSNTTAGMQEIVVNPSSMVAWRLSASGSLIPPHIHGSANGDSAAGGSGSTNQKRGAERLFQYLEADGSDPEDYTRLLKMDAISRNTASVAQDFHNAGGVEKDLKNIPAKISQAATQSIKEEKYFTAAGTFNYNNNIINSKLYQNKAMSSRNKEQFYYQQDIESPPAYLNPTKFNSLKGHRFSLMQHDKENSNSIFSNMGYQHQQQQAGFGLQFQKYVKEMINKYYAGTPFLYPLLDLKKESKDAQDYLEYLQNKCDITLTLTPPLGKNTKRYESDRPEVVPEKRHRKQAQPKKIKRDIISELRDKYMKRLVDRKMSCLACTNAHRKSMLIIPYHSKASLVLHRFWRHTPKSKKCHLCTKQFLRMYSLKIHKKIKHKITN